MLTTQKSRNGQYGFFHNPFRRTEKRRNTIPIRNAIIRAFRAHLRRPNPFPLRGFTWMHGGNGKLTLRTTDIAAPVFPQDSLPRLGAWAGATNHAP